ncbi:hypothetical protein NL676_009066 [Syzygium grande]|nr:hypothetical protein NL676_009066 [Syzygium grande]
MSRPNRELKFFDELLAADSAQVPGDCAQDFGAFGTATKHALPQSTNLILRPGRGGGHAPLEALLLHMSMDDGGYCFSELVQTSHTTHPRTDTMLDTDLDPRCSTVLLLNIGSCPRLVALVAEPSLEPCRL